MSAKSVTKADIKGFSDGDKLAWSAALFLGEKLSLNLATENPGPACEVHVILTGVDEVPNTGRNEFTFRGSFVDEDITTHNLAILGLPQDGKFEGTVKLSGIVSGELNIVE
jgi:hypothetical protein